MRVASNPAMASAPHGSEPRQQASDVRLVVDACRMLAS